MRLLNILAPAALLLGLSACATYSLPAEERAKLTPAAELFDAKTEFDIGLKVLKPYMAQPDCAPPKLVVACKDKVVVEKVRQYAGGAKAQIDSAEALVRAPDATPAQQQDAVAAARAATGAFAAFVVAQNIGGAK